MDASNYSAIGTDGRIMHKKLFLSLLPFLIATITTAAEDAMPLKAGWKLAWQDEFNEPELSATKWNRLTREQSKHNELQYYVPDEAYVENGSLRLRTRVRDYGSQHYTSGRIDTSGKFAPVYGRFEILREATRRTGDVARSLAVSPESQLGDGAAHAQDRRRRA